MIEANKTTCKICQQIKLRSLAGRFDSKNKRYNDENGKAWRGLVCADCHRTEIKQRMQAMRLLRKSLVIE